MFPSSWWWVLEGKVTVHDDFSGKKEEIQAPALWVPSPDWGRLDWEEARVVRHREVPSEFASGTKVLDSLALLMVEEVLLNPVTSPQCLSKALEFLFLHLKLRPYSGKKKKLEMGSVLNLFRERLDEPLTVTSVSKDLGCSVSLLHKLFKSHLGMGPMEALSELRLGQAAQQLLNSHEAVTSVAISVGYGDLATFSHAFKRRYAMSPREYRNQGQWLI